MTDNDDAKVIRMQSVNALIKQTKAAWDRADEKKADADDWYIRTGKMLVELKDRAGHGNWLPTLEKLGRSQRRAHELMDLAKGKLTVKDLRENTRNKVKKTRTEAKAKSALRNADLDPVDADEEAYFDDGMPPAEERWQYSLENLCAEIIARAPYWDKNFPGWQEFDPPSRTRKLMMEAKAAFASIVTITNKQPNRKAG